MKTNDAGHPVVEVAGETIVCSKLTAMPPGRDNIPANHPRRIAQIYHLSERELAHESVEVRQLCRDYRDALWASEKQAKIERGDIIAERESRLANIKFLLEPIYGSTNYAPIGGTIDRVLKICDL